MTSLLLLIYDLLVSKASTFQWEIEFFFPSSSQGKTPYTIIVIGHNILEDFLECKICTLYFTLR